MSIVTWNRISSSWSKIRRVGGYPCGEPCSSPWAGPMAAKLGSAFSAQPPKALFENPARPRPQRWSPATISILAAPSPQIDDNETAGVYHTRCSPTHPPEAPRSRRATNSQLTPKAEGSTDRFPYPLGRRSRHGPGMAPFSHSGRGRS